MPGYDFPEGPGRAAPTDVPCRALLRRQHRPRPPGEADNDERLIRAHQDEVDGA